MITKLICESKDFLVKAVPVLKDFKPAEAWKGGAWKLHPGAEKYFKEKQWLG